MQTQCHVDGIVKAAWIPKGGLSADGSSYDVITISFQQYLAAPPNIAAESGVEADEVQHIASPLKQWLGNDYTLVTSEHNSQQMLRVYVKSSLAHTVSAVATTGRPARTAGNGGLAIKLVVRSSSLCFIGCDLSSEPDSAAAGAGADAADADAEPQPITRSERLARRNGDAADIIGAGAAIGRPELDVSLQFDHTFCMGTLGHVKIYF